MADKTTYTLEAYDPSYSFGIEGEDHWIHYGGVYDTYAEAQENVEKANETYRKVQVVQHTRTVVAEYKDGKVSG